MITTQTNIPTTQSMMGIGENLMKTRTLSPNLHDRVTVLTIQERDTWILDRDYYLEQGYGMQDAEQRAWDHWSISRRAK